MLIGAVGCAHPSPATRPEPDLDALLAFLQSSPVASAIGAEATAQRLTGNSLGRTEQLAVSMRAVGIDSVAEMERFLGGHLDEVALLLRALRGRHARASLSGDRAHWVSFVLVTVARSEPDTAVLATDSGWDASYLEDARVLRRSRAEGALDSLAAQARGRGGAGVLGVELLLRPWETPARIPDESRVSNRSWPAFAFPGGRSIAAIVSLDAGERVRWDDYRLLVRRLGELGVHEAAELELPRLRPGGLGVLEQAGTLRLSLQGDEVMPFATWNDGRPLVRLDDGDLTWLPDGCCSRRSSPLSEWWVRLAEGDAAGLWLQLASQQFRGEPPPRPPGLGYRGPGAFGARTGTPSIDGARLIYWIQGAGPEGREEASSAPIFVLHGGPGLGSAYLREPLTATLGADRTLFFFDQRGSGYSEGADDPASLTMARLVRDLETVRGQSGLDRIDILGHSFGGLLAMRYAIAFPERVHRLILVDPDPATRSEWEAFAQLLEARTAPTDAARMAEIASVPGWDTSPEAFGEWFGLRLRAYVPDPSAIESLRLRFDEVSLRNQRVTPAAIRRDLGEWDLRDRLGRIRAPTLIVAGGASIFPPAAMENLGRHIPDAELVVLDGVGHFPFVEAPDRFARIVREFLRRTESLGS